MFLTVSGPSQPLLVSVSDGTSFVPNTTALVLQGAVTAIPDGFTMVARVDFSGPAGNLPAIRQALQLAQLA